MAPRKVSSSTPLLDDLGPVKVKPYCPVTVEPILLFVGVYGGYWEGVWGGQQQYIYYSLGNGTVHKNSGAVCGDNNSSDPVGTGRGVPAGGGYREGVCGRDPLQQYIYCSLWNGTVHNSSKCGDYNSSDLGGQQTQAEASQWLTYLQLCSSLPSLLIAAILGPMSDKVGRKVAIVTPVIGALASLLCAALVVYLNLPLQVFLPGALLYGMLGSSTTLYSGCFAYLTDITKPGNSRAMRMAILESCLGIAAVVGVLTGNLWLGVLGVPLGFQEPFFFAAGLAAFSLLYAMFGIKETCPKRSGQKVFTLASVSGMVHLVRHSFKTGQWKLGVILVVFFLNAGIYVTSSGIVTLTVIAPPYCWTPDLLGYFYVAICAGFVVSVLGIKLLGKCLSSYGLMHVGFLSGADAFVVVDDDDDGADGDDDDGDDDVDDDDDDSMPAPLMKAVMSKMVPQTQQGSLFALIACTESLAGVLFVPVWNSVFGATVFLMPGLVFLCFAGVLLIQIALVGLCGCLSPGHACTTHEGRHVQNGSLFALIACTESLAGVLFVPVWNSVFGATVFLMPGLVFLCFAGVLLIQIALVGVVQCHKRPTTYEVMEDDNDHIN
uniref:Major facilitator superfamily (MFS) profile domain-containing protein n=1 Tax=Branchiostoma floridae TaxID=7739 RepID=C3YMJ6_BRAFL|eukprot:XP_002602480.1 hypothetical protein BRAFLDRAFT_86864 [Branchiostoma floridae]